MHLIATIPPHLPAVPPLRSVLLALAKSQNIPDQTGSRAATILDELANNAIQYGSKPGGKITVELKISPGQCQIACGDEGGEHTVTAQELQAAVAAEVPVTPSMRGRGLNPIVKKFSDQLTIADREPGGILITSLLLY